MTDRLRLLWEDATTCAWGAVYVLLLRVFMVGDWVGGLWWRS